MLMKWDRCDNKMVIKLNPKRMGLLFFDITFLLFAFVGLNSDSYTTKLNIFFIPGNKNLYHFIVCGVFLITLFVMRRGCLKIDGVVIILAIKMIYDCINSFYMQDIPIENWVRWFQTDLAFLSYFVVINTDIKLKDLIKKFEFFSAIIAIQVIHVFILNRDLASYTFKNAMRIPFAMSNVISGVLVAALIAVVLQDDMRKDKRILLCLLYMAGILQTRSRSAIFLLDLLMLWRIRKTEHIAKRIRWYVLWITINVLAIIVVSKTPQMQAFFAGIKGFGSLNDFSTNRIDLLKYGFEEFKKSPLFGRGVYYDKSIFIGSTGIHNILLELLAESGIIGFALYMTALTLVVYKSKINKPYSKDNYQLVIFGILLSFFINSFVEVVYFNYIYDVLFWSFSAVMVKNLSCNTNDYQYCFTSDILPYILNKEPSTNE